VPPLVPREHDPVRRTIYALKRGFYRIPAVDPWLARLRHDLVKYAVWRARDLRDLRANPSPADLAALRSSVLDLRDAQGERVSATELFRRMRGETGAPADALDAFARVLLEAEAAVGALELRPQSWPAAVEAVLRIESAFESLARTLNRP